jgi:hypothetical protein
MIHKLLLALTIISGLVMAGGFLMMVWMSTFAPAGKAFESGRLGWAIMLTGLVGWIVFGFGWANTDD